MSAPLLSQSQAGANRPIQSRITKILASSATQDGNLVAALSTLAELGLADAATKGTSLRRDVEKRQSDGARAFLQAFGEVDAKLEQLQVQLAEMQKCCDDVGKDLERASDGTRYLLQHAQGLRDQRATSTLHTSMVSTFLTRFTLSAEELAVLTSRSPLAVGPAVFRSMDKVERIRRDCQALLAGDAALDSLPDVSAGEQEPDRTRAGISIMQASAEWLDAGYDKMTRWAAFEFRGPQKTTSTPHPTGGTFTQPPGDVALETGVSETMRECIKRLKQRPEQLKEVLDLLVWSRSSTLLTLFLNALTRGGPAPTFLPRPIELHAHDPLRYVGDMLAWVHQAMAGEREFLEQLFDLKPDLRIVGSARRGHVVRQSVALAQGLEVTDEARVRNLLDRHLEACGRPLKIRVQQTIRSQEGSLVAYKLSQLVKFYKITLEQTIGTDAGLSRVLTELAQSATETFFATLEAQSRSLLRFIQPPASDLSPPLMLRDTLITLRDLLAVQASSAADETSEEVNREADEVFDAALVPALEMCERMGEQRPSRWDRSIFAINCLAYVQSVLEPYSVVAGKRITVLDEQVRSHVEVLTNEHFTHLLVDSGLEPIIAVLDKRNAESKDGDTHFPLSHVPNASSRDVTNALRTFDRFLTATDLSGSSRLALLTPPRLASAIHRAALAKISEAYVRVHARVGDAKERYEFASTTLRRTPDEVAVLLGVIA